MAVVMDIGLTGAALEPPCSCTTKVSVPSLRLSSVMGRRMVCMAPPAAPAVKVTEPLCPVLMSASAAARPLTPVAVTA